MYKFEKSLYKHKGLFNIVFENPVANEKIGQRGISHLAEHCLFEGWKNLIPAMTTLSIQNNASTGDDSVSFYVKGLNIHLNKFKVPLYEGIMNYQVTEDVFERERKIVLQEYDSSFAGSTYNTLINYFRRHYNFYFSIGAKEDIESITFEEFKLFIKENFSKPAMVIDIGNKKEKYFNKIDYNDYTYKKEVLKRNDDPSRIETIAELDESSMFMSLINKEPIVNNIYNLRFIREMISDGGSLISPINNLLREQHGLVYNSGAFINNPLLYNNFLMIYGVGNEEKETAIENILFDFIDNPKAHFLNSHHFNKTKERLQLYFYNQHFSNYSIGDDKYYTENSSEFSLRNNLEDITLDGIIDYWNRYLRNNFEFISQHNVLEY